MTTLLLNLRLVAGLLLVAALAFTHFSAYRKGRQDVLTAQMAATAEANEDARRLERARQSRADQAAAIASQREAGLRAAADGARDAVGKLRDALAAKQRSDQSAATETQRAASLGVLLLESAEAHREMAVSCDRHVNDLRLYIESWPK